MKTNLSLLALTASIALAAAAFGQTPAATPAPPPVFAQPQKPMAERLADARTFLSQPQSRTFLSAANLIAGYAPIEEAIALADEIFDDPTQGVSDAAWQPSELLLVAVRGRLRALRTPDERIALLTEKKKAFAAYGEFVLWCDSFARNQFLVKASQLLGQRDYAAVIALLNTREMLGSDAAPRAIELIVKSKIALRSDDMLGWAKVYYFSAPYSASQDGINMVLSALRSADLNLTRANAFLQFQKDGVGANLLESIPVPEPCRSGVFSEPGQPERAMLNALIKGEKVEAIKIAVASFAAATKSSTLNAGVALVAQTLRNVDGNLIRANAFVAAQKEGNAFDIAELR